MVELFRVLGRVGPAVWRTWSAFKPLPGYGLPLALRPGAVAKGYFVVAWSENKSSAEVAMDNFITARTHRPPVYHRSELTPNK